MSHGIEGLGLILEAEQWQTREDRREGGDFLRATRPIGGRYYGVAVRSIQGLSYGGLGLVLVRPGEI